jgi:hypothetical protein
MVERVFLSAVRAELGDRVALVRGLSGGPIIMGESGKLGSDTEPAACELRTNDNAPRVVHPTDGRAAVNREGRAKITDHADHVGSVTREEQKGLQKGMQADSTYNGRHI